MPRVLLLGSHGFLGQHVLRALSQQVQLQVIMAPPRRRLDLVSASDAVWRAFLQAAQPDIIINCAGRTQGSNEALLRDNAVLVSRLLAALRQLRLRPWTVHLGCAAEYGTLPSGSCATETSVSTPLDSYGAAKLIATQQLLDAFAHGQLRGVVVRVFTPLGAGQSSATSLGQAAQMLRASCRDQMPIKLVAPSSFLDYLDVRDVAHAVVLAAQLSDLSGFSSPLLNVGSGRAASSRRLAEQLAVLAGFPGRVVEVAPSSPRIAPTWQQADINRLTALGWSPQYSLSQALAEVWRGSAAPTKGAAKGVPAPLNASVNSCA